MNTEHRIPKEHKMSKNKKILIIVIAAVVIVALAIASYFLFFKGEEKKESEPVETPKVWPLTGVADANIVNRPAVSVKIENDYEGRPQEGLESADIVWESVVEGGMTRFSATYNSNMPTDVGPIRSLRISDGRYLAPLKGLIVFSGSNGGRFQQVARDAGNQTIEEAVDPDGFHRVGNNAPHNDYFTLQTALDKADSSHKAPPPAQFQYASSGEKSTAEESGEVSDSMNITMSQICDTGWTWDAASKTYLRSQDGTPFMAKSGSRIASTNVIALMIDVGQTPEIDPAGTPEVDLKVTGSGDGYVMSGGKKMKVKWSKLGDKDLISLTTTVVQDGQEKETEVKLNPGNTWISFVSNDGGSIT